MPFLLLVVLPVDSILKDKDNRLKRNINQRNKALNDISVKKQRCNALFEILLARTFKNMGKANIIESDPKDLRLQIWTEV